MTLPKKDGFSLLFGLLWVIILVPYFGTLAYVISIVSQVPICVEVAR